ncbi:MAG: hypothetical protein HYY76_01505 [Acidobacteria bacterium]|nr:hypothetical protein [Acidobacteriota bacterium]
MIAVAIMATVLGGTMLLASQIQQAYSTDLDEVVVEQEVRFALDWITRVLRSAGSNPYGVETSTCASAVFQTVNVDPNANGAVDDIQIHADLTGPGGSPDRLLGGSAGSCNQAGEDVRIFYNAGTSTIRIQDQNTDATAIDMTEPVITGLQFVYYNASHTVLCGDPCATPANIDPDLVAYVKVRVTGQSTAYDTNLGDRATTTLESEVRIRTR